MPGSGVAPLRNAPPKSRTMVAMRRMARLLSRGHFLPDAAFFFPAIERLAINLVHGGLRDLHVVRRSAQEEIDVVDRAIGRFHIDARKVFAAAKTRKTFFMHLDQVEGELFAPMFSMKFLVTR